MTGLNPILSGGVAQPVLQVIFPVATATAPYNLSEILVAAGTDADLNYIGTRLGMPKDLNRNGSDGAAVAWDTGGELRT